MMDTQSAYTLWWSSIAILLVVTGVVALLLAMILNTARNILVVTGDIWTMGKQVANNTIHIPLLRETNRLAAQILETAVKIIEGSAAIEQHAEGCPGCPHCVLQ